MSDGTRKMLRLSIPDAFSNSDEPSPFIFRPGKAVASVVATDETTAGFNYGLLLPPPKTIGRQVVATTLHRVYAAAISEFPQSEPLPASVRKT
jgi:hypothetical protein